MDIARFFVHYFLHFCFPLILAFVLFRNDWRRAYLLMLLTMIVDVDHLFVSPIFDPNRGSIGFHFLHSYFIIPFYFLLLFFKGNFRIIGVGLVFHMLTDYLDMLLNPHL